MLVRYKAGELYITGDVPSVYPPSRWPRRIRKEEQQPPDELERRILIMT